MNNVKQPLGVSNQFRLIKLLSSTLVRIIKQEEELAQLSAVTIHVTGNENSYLINPQVAQNIHSSSMTSQGTIVIPAMRSNTPSTVHTFYKLLPIVSPLAVNVAVTLRKIPR